MSTKYSVVVVLLILSFSYLTYASEYFNVEEDVHEGSSCEIKISTALSAMKAEINSKLDAIYSKNTKELDKTNHAIQEDLDEKFHRLQNNLLHKLEEYLDEKSNSFEKLIYRKIESLETMILDKTDSNIINHKLDALKTYQLESDGSALCSLANKTSRKIEENIEQNLKIIQKTIFDLENARTNFIFPNNLTNLEENFNHKWTELKKMVPVLEENIKSKLDALDKKVSEHFDEKINLKLDATKKTINDNIERKLVALDKKFDEKLNDMQKKNPELEQNIIKKMDALQNTETDILYQVTETRYGLNCKKQRVSNIAYVEPYHRLDNETLKYVTYRNSSNSTGFVYFEMHFAVKGNKSAFILLKKQSASANETFHIGIFPGSISFYRDKEIVAAKVVPDMLMTTRFTNAYVKINNGTLEMGKEGSSSPILGYYNTSLKSVEYFSFATWQSATFLYDCPSSAF